MVNEEVLSTYYSEMAETLNSMIPIDWKRVVMLAEVEKDWSTTTFYFISEDDNVYHWGDIFDKLGGDEDEFDELFEELEEINEAFWNEFNEAGVEVWNAFTFDLTSEGTFKINFDYDDNIHNVGTRERHLRWAYNMIGLVPKDENGKELLKAYLVAQGREEEIEKI